VMKSDEVVSVKTNDGGGGYADPGGGQAFGQADRVSGSGPKSEELNVSKI